MSAYPRPIYCVKCQCDLAPEKNAVWLVVLAHNPPVPYAIWAADLWKCPGCGVEIVSGYSRKATLQHEDGFAELLARTIRERVYYVGGRR